MIYIQIYDTCIHIYIEIHIIYLCISTDMNMYIQANYIYLQIYCIKYILNTHEYISIHICRCV